ncbi:MAG: zonular occludens toxin domain-containing protein [Pseudomonadota bacterium]
MIQCICGLPGNGKTLYAVWLAHELISQGRRVATNIEITGSFPYADQIYRIGCDNYPIVSKEGCYFNWFPGETVFIIDEADAYFDSEDWGKIASQNKLYLKQHRKRGDDVIFLLQYPTNLWVRIRRMVNEWVWCRKDGELNIGQGFIDSMIYSMLPEKMRRFRRASYVNETMLPNQFIRGGHFTFAEAEQIYGWYKTEQLIGAVTF